MKLSSASRAGLADRIVESLDLAPVSSTTILRVWPCIDCAFALPKLPPSALPFQRLGKANSYVLIGTALTPLRTMA
jgi:hypothetical protein